MQHLIEPFPNGIGASAHSTCQVMHCPIMKEPEEGLPSGESVAVSCCTRMANCLATLGLWHSSGDAQWVWS